MLCCYLNCVITYKHNLPWPLAIRINKYCRLTVEGYQCTDCTTNQSLPSAINQTFLTQTLDLFLYSFTTGNINWFFLNKKFRIKSNLKHYQAYLMQYKEWWTTSHIEIMFIKYETNTSLYKLCLKYVIEFHTDLLFLLILFTCRQLVWWWKCRHTGLLTIPISRTRLILQLYNDIKRRS